MRHLPGIRGPGPRISAQGGAKVSSACPKGLSGRTGSYGRARRSADHGARPTLFLALGSLWLGEPPPMGRYRYTCCRGRGSHFDGGRYTRSPSAHSPAVALHCRVSGTPPLGWRLRRSAFSAMGQRWRRLAVAILWPRGVAPSPVVGSRPAPRKRTLSRSLKDRTAAAPITFKAAYLAQFRIFARKTLRLLGSMASSACLPAPLFTWHQRARRRAPKCRQGHVRLPSRPRDLLSRRTRHRAVPGGTSLWFARLLAAPASTLSPTGRLKIPGATPKRSATRSQSSWSSAIFERCQK